MVAKSLAKSLAISLGDTTVQVDVVSESPLRWSAQGSAPRVPVELLRDLFDEARAAGVPEAALMAPRVTYTEDGALCEVPMAYKVLLTYAR